MAGIERSIRDSDLGVNPTNDGAVIRVTMPELTEERRREYIKVAKAKAEDARISVRGARRTAKEALDKMVKDKEVGEDEVARAEKQLDASTKKYVDSIDDVLKHKEAELLEV
jgi:ribosome recycling factor